MKRICALIFLLVGGALVLPAQFVHTSGFEPSTAPGTVRVTFTPGRAAPVKIGAPYCGDQVSERNQLLADGTRLHRKDPARRTCRDALGRTRSDGPFIGGPIPTNLLVMIEDPVAGFGYLLERERKIAHRMKLQPAQPRVMPPPNPTPPPPDPNRPQSRSEKLGTQMIHGVRAEGNRNILTMPVGSIEGNDRPLTRVFESWFAPDLGLVLKHSATDPRMGESSMRYENFSLAPPDPALFQVPADYKIVDETGPFTIEIQTGPRP